MVRVRVREEELDNTICKKGVTLVCVCVCVPPHAIRAHPQTQRMLDDSFSGRCRAACLP